MMAGDFIFPAFFECIFNKTTHPIAIAIAKKQESTILNRYIWNVMEIVGNKSTIPGTNNTNVTTNSGSSTLIFFMFDELEIRVYMPTNMNIIITDAERQINV